MQKKYNAKKYNAKNTMQKIKLSILILTHNRPALFERCIKSVLKNKPDNVQVLVNNDSNDIDEVPGATYFYENNKDITKTYQYLFDKAIGEFIYFLEDDDYVVPDFYDIMNEVSTNTVFRYVPYSGISDYFKFWKGDFDYNFQIGQMVFRKEDLKEFPTRVNYVHNDYEIYKSVNTISKFKYSKQNIFHQTTDGNDNISFYYLNKDERFGIDDKYR